MAVQLITNKIVKKYDTQHPNFNPEPKVEKEVNGNTKDDSDEYNKGNSGHPNELGAKMWAKHLTEVLKEKFSE